MPRILDGAGNYQSTDTVGPDGTETMPDGANLILGIITGTQFGTAANQKSAFHGATPVVQRAGAAQAAVTPTIGAAVATTSSTNSGPFGYTTGAQADGIITAVNALLVDVGAIETLLNEVRAALVAKGVIKGSA